MIDGRIDKVFAAGSETAVAIVLPLSFIRLIADGVSIPEINWYGDDWSPASPTSARLSEIEEGLAEMARIAAIEG